MALTQRLESLKKRHIESLKKRHAEIEDRIREEELHSSADENLIHQLKREKLFIKDELSSVETQEVVAA